MTIISILSDVKKLLGFAEDYTVFDVDITLHINSTIATLTQIGVGPPAGFAIDDGTEEWEAFIGTDPRLNPAKTVIYQKARLRFDPPTSSFAVAAIEEDIKEQIWRLNVTMEETIYTDPDPDTENETVLDGGGP